MIRILEKFEGRKFNYEPRNDIEQRYALYPAETVERIRRQVSLSALEGLAVKLGALREGRKAVIVVSEGYTAVLPPQLRDPVATMPGMGNPQSPQSGRWREQHQRGPRRHGRADRHAAGDAGCLQRRQPQQHRVLHRRSARARDRRVRHQRKRRPARSNESLRQTQDTLRVLADETDGRAIVNRNDLARAMKQIVVDSSAYYLLGYNSIAGAAGRQVSRDQGAGQATGDRRCRARKGYWALTATETARVTARPKPGPPPAVSKALSSISEPSRGRFVRTWIGHSRGADGKTRVTFVWEPLPATPGMRREEATSVSVIAASTEGQVYFRGQAPAKDEAATNGGSTTTLTQGYVVELRCAARTAAASHVDSRCGSRARQRRSGSDCPRSDHD